MMNFQAPLKNGRGRSSKTDSLNGTKEEDGLSNKNSTKDVDNQKVNEKVFEGVKSQSLSS